ncbi:sugar phosphate isomerase/epimerase family protein [Paenibacillus allorhizosphaerae]|uniref:Xylose isomerase-like TIM barrel domain-containing protein n=1 Tax=Paenibacillus allorhizosphaerae TaxID=2849866 RepID=A0ABM8VI15_9BACL|nr:sugar phosphate isomerase/epimerase family protein [Paenibacillus allorhizosphaerae]CAG7643350.1 hypothetical protein PAECIP111802_02999 [Paenibacillus allorhizosphaerae]
MKIGWCTSIQNAELLKEIGYDFIELPVAPLPLEQDSGLADAMKPILASPIPTSAFNILFPKDMKLVGPDANDARIRHYIARAAAVLSEARAGIIVLGSGGARNVPDHCERLRAEQQLLQVLDWCADELKGTGVTLAIEPLNRKESNIINSVDEAVEYAQQINRPEVRVLADFYHMDEEQEPLDALRTNGAWLAHIHLADTGRRHPGSGTYDYNTFFGILKEIGYTGMISAECKADDPANDMRSSLQFLKQFVS